jgi:glucoamylase
MSQKSPLFPVGRGLVAGIAASLALTVLAHATSALAAGSAPGAPGQPAVWTPANKDGFGTSTSTSSHLWYTLGSGELTELYYPNLGTPSVRDLQLIVSDGKTFADRETDSTTHHVQLTDRRSLTYRQVNVDKAGRYEITKTYVTDPRGNALLVDIRFRSLTGKPYAVYALYDPSLSNNGNDDSGTSTNGRLLAFDGTMASALIAEPAFRGSSTGYLGTSDGWTDLRSDYRMDWHYTSATNGNVVQTAHTTLNGTTRQYLLLSLGFGPSQNAAFSAASGGLARGTDAVAAA